MLFFFLKIQRPPISTRTYTLLPYPTLFRSKRRVRRDAAAARLDQAAIEARLDRRDFVQQWFSGWAEWRTAEQRAQTGQRRVSLVSRFAELAVKQFNVGDISGLDRDLAQMALSQAQAELSALVEIGRAHV